MRRLPRHWIRHWLQKFFLHHNPAFLRQRKPAEHAGGGGVSLVGDETALECCVAQFHGQIAGDDDGLGTLNSILRDQYDDDLLLFSRFSGLTAREGLPQWQNPVVIPAPMHRHLLRALVAVGT